MNIEVIFRYADASTHRWWFMPSWLKVKAADEGEEAAETAHEAEPETLRPTGVHGNCFLFYITVAERRSIIVE